MGILFLIVKVVILLGVVGILALVIYAHCKPTDDLQALLEQRSPLKLEKITDTEVEFSTEFDVQDKGVELSTINDAFARPFLPQEQYDLAVASTNVERLSARRKDNYFEAMLLDPGDKVRLIMTLHFKATEGHSIREAMKSMVDMDAAVYISGSSRKEFYIKRFFTTFLSTEFQAALGGGKNE